MEAMKVVAYICAIIAGVGLGFSIYMSITNYKEIKMHRHALSKLIDEFEKFYARAKAKELADRITDMIFGNDKPEDLEEAIKAVAKDEGIDEKDVTIVVKKKKTEKKAEKKPAKKTTKKENK